MKIIFMGTTNFALKILEKLINNGCEVVAVYTQPPRPAGRGKKVNIGPVGNFAIQNKMNLLYPSNFANSIEIEKFENFEADLVIVSAYGLILPANLLLLSKLGFFNVHASLLPRWRGAAPIQRALLAGDKETGICVIKLEPTLDTGPIVLKESLQIFSEDNAGSLHDKLANLGADLTVKLCRNVNCVKLQKQADLGILYAKKIEKNETRIDWNTSSANVRNRIRAFSPAPGAWFDLNGERIKILEAALGDSGGKIGLVTTKPFQIVCKMGSVRPTILQRPGRTPVPVEDFLRGYQISGGTIVS